MIIGLAKNSDNSKRAAVEVVKGLYAVRGAYSGEYDFFESSAAIYTSTGVDVVKKEKIADVGKPKSSP